MKHLKTQSITRENHYVPQWYQRRFLVPGVKKLAHLDLSPPTVGLKDGHTKTLEALTHRSPAQGFFATDLYTTQLADVPIDTVERLLFGAVDNDGSKAVKAFSEGDHVQMHRNFRSLFGYLGAQHLRTPRGLEWIKARYPTLSQETLMEEMRLLMDRNSTMWVEGVREIVSARDSDVKFILTDNPVTFYNASCQPESDYCLHPEDPPLALNGTQTLFPLDQNHCLLITHLDYARDPHGVRKLANRQNARHFGQTVAKTDALIRSRKLSRDQVVAVNYALKRRADHYIAAGHEAWLRPEKEFHGTWEDIGLVLAPPKERLLGFGGEIYMGFTDGQVAYQDAYGRRSKIHEALKKDPPADPIGLDDLCGCGNGRSFGQCCQKCPVELRPAWDVLSIRERNIAFLLAVTDILKFDRENAWDSIREDLNGDHVRRIHEVLQSLWPPDTNLSELLPRADPTVSRAIYMGPVDARTVVTSVCAWTRYFDEIVVVNPFQFPANLKPEFSPLENPNAFRTQTLRNVFFLSVLEPFILAGIVHLIPDPCEFDNELQWEMLSAAKNHSAGHDHDIDLEGYEPEALIAKHERRALANRLTPEAISSITHKLHPELTAEVARAVAQQFKSARQSDPLAPLTKIKPGGSSAEFISVRGVNAEMALVLGQLTGSIIYTDSKAFAQRLCAITGVDAKEPVNAFPVGGWADLPWTIDADPSGILSERDDALSAEIRSLVRLVIRSVMPDVSSVAPSAAAVKDQFESLRGLLKAFWDSHEESLRLEGHVRAVVPSEGFRLPATQRFLLRFPLEMATSNVPMALFASLSPIHVEAADDDDDFQEAPQVV